MLPPENRCGFALAGLFLCALFAGAASAAPCCIVTAIDTATGTVTAEETSTGTTFEFKVLRRQLENLEVGSPLDADLEARAVIFDDRSIPMRKVTRARIRKDAPVPERDGSSAEMTDGAETDREPRERGVGPNPGARGKTQDTSASSTEKEAPRLSAAESDPPDAARGERDPDRRRASATAQTDVAEEPSEETGASEQPAQPDKGYERIHERGETLNSPDDDGERNVRRVAGNRAQKANRQKKKEPDEGNPYARKPNTVPSQDSQQLNSGARRGSRNVPARAKQCYVGGCSSQICSDKQDVLSSCEWKDAYACYANAECKLQATGACGWTQTQALEACLSAALEP